MQARRQFGPNSWTAVTFLDTWLVLCSAKRVGEPYRGQGMGLRLLIGAALWMASKCQAAASSDSDAY